MTCFLYSFPLGLCIRLWDNILAFGTRFIFNISISILLLLRDQLIELEFCDINEFFKCLKDDTHLDKALLPPIEKIIEQAQKIYIGEDKIKELFMKHRVAKPIPKPIEHKKVRRGTITLPPKPVVTAIEVTKVEQL